MIELGSSDILLFDGDCGICSAAADFGKKIARGGDYAIEPYQRFSEEQLGKFGIDHEACSRKIHTITRDGRVHAGAFSVNHFLWRHFPWTLIPLTIYMIPILIPIELVAYALVAHNRRTISRWLGLTACALPQR